MRTTRGRCIALLLGLAVWLLPAGGCLLSNMEPSEKLNDAILGMNEAARWGRVDLALQYIDPVYRSRFLESHHGWGRTIEVADSELLRIEVAPDQDAAVALVAFSWYKPDRMSLRSTVLRQVWKRYDGNYILGSEEVIEGDAELLKAPGKRLSEPGLRS